MNKEQAKERLEYLRGEIKAERISYGELAELQSLAEYIEEGDVELLEWAGVPENGLKVFRVNGYWEDDKDNPISGYLIAESDSIDGNRVFNDEDIFYYGMSEQEIKDAIQNKESIDGFIITGYEVA